MKSDLDILPKERMLCKDFGKGKFILVPGQPHLTKSVSYHIKQHPMHRLPLDPSTSDDLHTAPLRILRQG